MWNHFESAWNFYERQTRNNEKLSNQEYVEFTLVLNEDELSFSESLLIKKEMDELGFRLSNIIINKAQDELKLQAKKISEIFRDSKIYLLPLCSEDVVSFDQLKALTSTFISYSR